MRTFCTVSRRPHGAARAADSAPRPSLSLALTLRGECRSAGAKAKYGRGPRSTQGDQGRGGFDKGTLAAARIGLKRARQEAARSRASV